MKTILDQIIDTKREEVATAKRAIPLSELQSKIRHVESPRDFFGTVIKCHGDKPNLIAEIKKASPSAGLIRANFDPAAIARIYHEHGAAAISVLTDETYFQGSLAHIQTVKDAVPLPVLRKDFIIDDYQIYEARAAGADAILLIAEALEPDAIASLLAVSHGLAMTTLLEVHSEKNLDHVVGTIGFPNSIRCILGINNRDLAVQKTDLHNTVRLASRLPNLTPFVSESGISSFADLIFVRDAGAAAILVGEALLREEDIGVKIDELMGN